MVRFGIEMHWNAQKQLIPTQIWEFFGIFEQSSLKAISWNAPEMNVYILQEMHAFHLEMHEIPLPDVVILWFLLFHK